MEIEQSKVFLEVIDIKEIGEGMRVCIDFIDVLQQNDGLYVGNTGHGYIKVLSENRQSDGYPPRPFRINCGSYHQYLFQEDKSIYLHEVDAGNQIEVTGEQDNKSLSVGRVKIEKRPFLRVECKNGDSIVSATLQKSTSVHVVEESKGDTSIIDLNVGDRIACMEDMPGRHLGEKIDEFIIEK
ncbi:3-dehydroquinate synthase [Salipaludibacillus neizhouensis]|uniref:3-dehydroquinate synthase n=1 Tax=Salipaludibacillus neizhouensis TaxID=885475 RepID=A0A3A9K8B7_9BACI|nr:3-dehydroquinate synthase II [Salipaludibacillus neizhouensis]RKL66611.1 3-dehydroquinate synthase [Salipaludibacillus neizhouensis]